METYVNFLVNCYILSMEQGAQSAAENEKEKGAEGFKEKGDHMKWLSKVMKE